MQHLRSAPKPYRPNLAEQNPTINPCSLQQSFRSASCSNGCRNWQFSQARAETKTAIVLANVAGSDITTPPCLQANGFFRHGAAENDPVHATEGEELAMRTGLYPGTFDPMTLGHLDIIRRACSLVDRLVVGVAMNMEKSPLFELEERVAMVEAEAALLQKETGTSITAHPFENLLIDCANEVGASVIIRGLRAVSDFEYEYQMVGMNRALESGVETVFLMADAKCQVIASKLVKEIARLGGDISTFVSPQVESSVRQKFVTG